jgi:hypothetical protein
MPEYGHSKAYSLLPHFAEELEKNKEISSLDMLTEATDVASLL